MVLSIQGTWYCNDYVKAFKLIDRDLIIYILSKKQKIYNIQLSKINFNNHKYIQPPLSHHNLFIIFYLSKEQQKS